MDSYAFLMLEMEYSGFPGSVPCLLMPRFLKSPEHQKAWHWLFRTAIIYCCSRVNFIYFGEAKRQLRFRMWMYGLVRNRRQVILLINDDSSLKHISFSRDACLHFFNSRSKWCFCVISHVVHCETGIDLSRKYCWHVELASFDTANWKQNSRDGLERLPAHFMNINYVSSQSRTLQPTQFL